MGHTSSTMSESASAFTSSGSSIERTPCCRRSGWSVSSAPHTDSGPASSPAWGVARSPASLAIANASAKGSGRPMASSLARPKDDHAPVGAARGEPGLLDRHRRLDGAVGREHEADADAQLLAGGLERVEDHVDDLLVGAEAVAVVRCVERRLDPDRAVEHAVLDHLEHQPCEVVGGQQHLARRHVGLGERAERAVAADLGDGDPGDAGELGQRGRAHRPLEVDVQVALGQRAEVARRSRRHGEHRRARIPRR